VSTLIAGFIAPGRGISHVICSGRDLHIPGHAATDQLRNVFLAELPKPSATARWPTGGSFNPFVALHG